ncbi:MAG: YqeG family HAD IIIA-type phosphatase [Candidatus Saccharibacteria bacterium]
MKTEAHTIFTDKKTAPRYLPDFSAESVLDIDFKKLQSLGVKHMLFDLDLTIRRLHADEIEAEIIAYLVGLRDKGVIQSLNLATNNMSNKLGRFSKPLGARVFQPFYRRGMVIRKPNARYFAKILQDLEAQPHEVAMIGDKAMFDVAGGNKVGMVTVLVKPQGKDPLHDKVLFIRMREKRHLKAARALAAQIQNR